VKYVPKRAPEVNVPREHPLLDVWWMLAGVVALGMLLWVGGAWLTDRLVVRISLAQELEYGRRFAPDTSSVRASDPRLGFMRDLVKGLAGPGLETPLLPHVQIWDLPDANAFVLPGGRLAFSTAFLEQARSENELAFVAAHELGHYVHRDAIRGAGRALWLFSLALLAGQSGENGAAPLFGQGPQALALKYSRDAESAADLFAAEAVARRYGHLQGALDFFQRNADEEGETLAWFSTHPASQARIDRLRAWGRDRGLPETAKPKGLPRAWQPQNKNAER
jgi:Zn-dependent protease with chaperone function